MNAFYVTVSIPLLLVLLAGFNHAHGLTTFGKSNNNQGTQQQQKPIVKAKACTSQVECVNIKGTSCLKGHCLCGNNEPAANGNCSNVLKGANHICNNDDECVNDADCLSAKDRNKTGYGLTDKICVCREGLIETPGGTCGGESTILVLPGLAMIIATLCRTLY